MNDKKANIEQVKNIVQQAWWTGVNAVNGYQLVSSEVVSNDYSSITHICAIGKAASSMMLAAYDHLTFSKGLLITKYRHIDRRLSSMKQILTIESGHPVPDQNSLQAGQQLCDFICSLSSQDNLLMLVSGGASSLAEKLPSSMNLKDLQMLNEVMLSKQKTIAQINAKRSEVSLIKNAKLLNQCKANSITTLAISDVQGDDIKVIGSGIGACNLDHSDSKIIGSNKIARHAIETYCKDNQIDVICNQESLYGDVFLIADRIAATVREGNTGAYIFGGEPTIELPVHPGKGGRNQSLALALAKEIEQQPGIVAIVAGSDGTDGPTDAAGGLVDANTFGKSAGAENALRQANAGYYLEQADALFVSGPTGTNVMDLIIVIKLEQ